MPNIVFNRWSFIACSVGVVALAACGGTTEPPAPGGITVTPSTLSFSYKGGTKQLTAAVTDQHGNALPNATVTWSSNSIAVATVSSSGLVASVGNGTTQIVATAGSVSTQVTVTVAQAAFTLTKTAGDNQSASAGTQLPQALAVQVTDSLGNPVSGATVSFSVTSGSGIVTPLSALTDASGNASTRWTIGDTVAAQQRVTASSGTLTAAVFSATATAGPPSTVVKLAGDNQKLGTGTAVSVKPAVQVSDQYGNPIANVTVTFTPGMTGGTVTGGTVPTTAAGVATVGGWTMSASPGTDTLIATVAGTGITAKFVATVRTPGPPASVIVQVGDGQTGLVGYAVNFAPAVLVRDTAGIPSVNAAVTFGGATGGSSVSGGSVMTGSDGVATVGSWTLGTTPGSATLTATVTGSGITGNPVTFTATGQAAAYTITLRYLGAIPTGTRKAAVDSAVAHWQRIIYGALPPVPLQSAADACFKGQPAINETVNNILIYFSIDSIDGPGKILAEAGPCYARSDGTWLPVMGLIRVDSADIATYDANGQLPSIILHEMGHVLGFGTIWTYQNLLAGAVAQGGTDPHFVGSQANAAFDRIGGTNYTGGAKVPVENVGGPGSIDGHWRESVFGNELMTSILNAGTNPLSVLSVASMGDDGYTVNYAAADPYMHTFSLFAGPATASDVHMKNDILNLPLFLVDAAGRVTRVLRR
jgi:hypothetical protein